MAGIVLASGESFEHSHQQPSTTTLTEGSVEFSMNGNTFALQAGHVIEVPANVPHTIKNIGGGLAIVACGHGPSIG